MARFPSCSVIVHARGLLAILIGSIVLVSACGDGFETGAERGEETGFHPDGWEGVPVIPPDIFDPVAEGVPTPAGFRQVLRRDGIFPVYVPTFRRSDEIDWPDEELVIGVDLDGEARAYPVGFLNRREIVVDMHRGIPTFVTW